MFFSGSSAKRGGLATALTVTVLVGVAVLTASAQASGPPRDATRTTSPPGPPLVTERLGSVLPCNQQTQIGLDCPGAGARSPLQMSSVDRRDCL
jgi:hypothetical protein